MTIISLDRHEVRNTVDSKQAGLLTAAFSAFDTDDHASVAVLHGRGGNFCAGADLKAVARGEVHVGAPDEGLAGMGPTRMLLSKPVIAAVEGYAVADLRVVDPDATFGVFCRRWGVPLIDGGTVRLPRLIGQSHALDLILTGRPVTATEALRMGLANRISASGQVLAEAIALAEDLTACPQTCLREDRLSLYEQDGLSQTAAIDNEWRHGLTSLAVDTALGAARFAAGEGRHGSFR